MFPASLWKFFLLLQWGSLNLFLSKGTAAINFNLLRAINVHICISKHCR